MNHSRISLIVVKVNIPLKKRKGILTLQQLLAIYIKIILKTSILWVFLLFKYVKLIILLIF
jgi:hypothetical protein